MAYKSEIYEVIHQDATAMFEVGGISEARMREYDEMCLIQEPKSDRKTPKPIEIGRNIPATARI